MAEAESTTQLDILGILATDMGMTGENISRKIFSYLDIFSLMRGRMVSKIWNRYLSQQKCIWMAHLRKTLSFLDYFEEMFQDVTLRSLLNKPARLTILQKFSTLLALIRVLLA